MPGAAIAHALLVAREKDQRYANLDAKVPEVALTRENHRPRNGPFSLYEHALTLFNYRGTSCQRCFMSPTVEDSVPGRESKRSRPRPHSQLHGSGQQKARQLLEHAFHSRTGPQIIPGGVH